MNKNAKKINKLESLYLLKEERRNNNYNLKGIKGIRKFNIINNIKRCI